MEYENHAKKKGEANVDLNIKEEKTKNE